MRTKNSNRMIVWVAIATILAWLGEYIHNRVELPQPTFLSPENSLPALIFLILFIGWVLLPYKRVMAVLMILWAMLHLTGGAVITVIPFPFLPFFPEQSLRHYLAHLFYGAAQIPLISLMIARLKAHRPGLKGNQNYHEEMIETRPVRGRLSMRFPFRNSSKKTGDSL